MERCPPNRIKPTFALGSPEDLHTLLDGAGFHDVVLHPTIKTLRFPSSEEFVRLYVAATPLAGVVARVDDNARAALITEVSGVLQSYVDSEGLAFPIEAHLVVAHT